MLAGSPQPGASRDPAGPMRDAVDRKRTILREVALALAAGAFVTVSPFTPNELAPSVAAGAAVTGGLLAWRLRRGSTVWTRPAAGVRRIGRRELIGGLACLLSLGVFAPTLQWMYREWTRSVWVNDHGLFVPPFMAWFAWTALREDDGPAESSAWGFLPLAAGFALAAIDSNAQSRYLSSLGLLLVLPGLSLLLLGVRRTRALRVPLLLAVLLVPVPFTLATPLALREITASGVMPMLQLLGFTGLREGTRIEIPGQTFLVADACSGMATLYASVAFSLMLAATIDSRWRQICLVALAPFLAIFVNVVRVTCLVLLTQWLGRALLDTPIHYGTGVATFGIVMAVLFLVAHAGAPRARHVP